MKRKYPKQYTAKLSRKDKKKQLTALGKLKKAYSKGKYLDRPTLKSYKNKESGWTAKFHKLYPEAKSIKQVAKAEKWLIDHGFSKVRVRMQGIAGRIEVPDHQINDLIMNSNRKELVDFFLSIGFSSISVDLEGLVSGKLNRDKV